MSRRGDFGYGSLSASEFGGHSSAPDSRGPVGFDVRFKELSDSISGNIFTVGANGSTMEHGLRQIGTPADSTQLRSKLHDIEKSTNAVVNKVTSYLRLLSSLTSQSSSNRVSSFAVYKLQWQRLMGEFKEVTQRYNIMQKKVAEKAKLYKLAPPLQSGCVPTADLLGWNDESAEQRRQNEHRQRQLLMQEEAIDIDVALMQEREQQIHQLEADILDVNQIFRELGMLIHEQGEVIDTIEANVTHAHDNVDAGREQLQKAATYQVRARKKKCCLVAILLVVVAVIVIVIVLSVKFS